MQIGIIGTGRMGEAIGRVWLAKGHRIFYGSRDPERGKSFSASLGSLATGGSIAEAAAFADILLMATTWAGVAEAIQAAGSLAGKIIIDCTLPLVDHQLAVPADSSGAQEIAKQAAQAQVVKAFNTIHYTHFANPMIDGKRITTFICGDSLEAKATVIQLATEIGLDAVDVGPLFAARHVEGMGLCWILLSILGGYGDEIGFRLLR